VSERPTPQAEALQRVAAAEPQLAARAVLMTMPAAALRLSKPLTYDVTVDGLGTHRVELADGRGRIDPITDAQAADGAAAFRMSLDPETLVHMASGGGSPLRLALSGRLRIRGKRRRARRLKAVAKGPEPTLAEVAQAGGRIDPDVVYRMLPYLVDPTWTRGHRFCVAYEVGGEGGGTWFVQARDGEPLAVSADAPAGGADVRAQIGGEEYQRIVSGDMTPATALQQQAITAEGALHPLTLMGRWIDRSQGNDDRELEREAVQRELQAKRRGIWGSAPATGPGQGDPGHIGETAARGADGLLDYQQLYALWERQQWAVHELDFSEDQKHWLASPTEAQANTLWSLGSFYVAEERVTSDLAPFLMAAPSGEVEMFLATQLVDEARHAVFFDRFGAEVMGLAADDFRGRMAEIEKGLEDSWRVVFDDGLREIAKRIKADPDDQGLFVQGIATYHLVLEGFLAVTGQTFIRGYMEDHSVYPGFCKGFGLVERDEHRHIAFGVRFLKDAVDSDERHRATIERTVLELVPKAALAIVPPYATDPGDWTTYAGHSSEFYGYAYRTLKRRMGVLGISIPPPDELLPGSIQQPAQPALPAATGDGAPTDLVPAASNGHSVSETPELPPRTQPQIDPPASPTSSDS
jgi:ribonucleoside-diphosphate reductase beta chain